MQLAQTRLLVSDLGPAYDFYTQALGLKPQRGDRNGQYEKLAFPTGDAAIALQTRKTSPAALTATDRTLIVIRVDDVDELSRTLVQRGANLVVPPATQFGRLRAAYLRDPEGNLIELQMW